MGSTVFYSWQKDLPNSTNWSFIEKALHKAIDALSMETDLTLDVNLDRDTQDVAGMPDIVSTIFSKIDNAAVFVGDISIIAKTERKGLPNPNVSIELGYAAGKLDWDSIICVFNLAFGDVNDLPFDLRTRRILTYEVYEDSEKALARDILAKDLHRAIKAILLQAQQRTPHLNVRHRTTPHFRFGIQNIGSLPIEVLQVRVEYPRKIRLENWSPMPYSPVLEVDQATSESGEPLDIITYTKTDALCPMNPNIRRLPPIIGSGQLYWMESLVVGFTRSGPPDTIVRVRVTTREMGIITKEMKLSELIE
jgi:hypothetical protein